MPRGEWATTSAGQVMRPDRELWTALQQMHRDGVNRLPVMTDSQVVGMLSREDVLTFLRTLQELGAEITARSERDPGEICRELPPEFGAPSGYPRSSAALPALCQQGRHTYTTCLPW